MSTFIDTIKERRSYYALESSSPISDDEIQSIVEETIKYSPSAFNSQSAVAVLALGDSHNRVWNIVMDKVKPETTEEQWPKSKKKLESFKAAYGTVLFFENDEVTKGLQDSIPLYADRFAQWAEHSQGMAEFNVWTALEEAGLGASLQHYNPLIDDDIKALFDLPDHFRLIAQMPFGKPAGEPGNKDFKPISERVKVFK
ncbi:MAG: nitroreductase family protein [Bacillota bacterium]